MHPILTGLRRVELYLAAWIPAAAMLGYLFVSGGGFGMAAAAITAVVLSVVLAVMCLAAWPPCKATPLGSTGVVRIIATHAVAGSLVSGVWVAVSRGIVSLAAELPRFHGVDVAAKSLVPILFGFGVLMYVICAAFFYAWLALEKSAEAQQNMLRATTLARDAEIKALKAQINPHFLFNSLNSISALTSIDPARAREMCIALAEFMRMTLGLSEKQTITLDEELALTNKFLSIEQVRFGHRLHVSQTIDATSRGCLVLPLMLQPLVENAVSHGISQIPDGGSLNILANVDADERALRIEVLNDVDPDSVPKTRNGVGLKNVRERLVARYGSAASVAAVREETKFKVTLLMPVERNGKQ